MLFHAFCFSECTFLMIVSSQHLLVLSIYVHFQLSVQYSGGFFFCFVHLCINYHYSQPTNVIFCYARIQLKTKHIKGCTRPKDSHFRFQFPPVLSYFLLLVLNLSGLIWVDLFKTICLSSQSCNLMIR